MSCILYSTDCPKCKVLETKLEQKNINFDLVKDVEIMESKGFMHAPNLEVNGTVYDFSKSIQLVNSYDGESDFEMFVTSREAE